MTILCFLRRSWLSPSGILLGFYFLVCSVWFCWLLVVVFFCFPASFCFELFRRICNFWSPNIVQCFRNLIAVAIFHVILFCESIIATFDAVPMLNYIFALYLPGSLWKLESDFLDFGCF